MTLTDEAKAAHEAMLAAAATAEAAERKALRTAALEAVRASLTRPDGTSLTLAQSGLQAVHTDLPNGLIVASDGTVALAAQRREDGVWTVRMAEQVDGGWTAQGDRLRSLADLGQALAATA